MIDEWRKSLGAILNERLRSPLYGTFIVSWLIINWRIWYITFFLDSAEINGTKLEYIEKNLLGEWNILWYPVGATLAILIVGQGLALLAFWSEQKFKKWRIDIKNDIEGQTLLTKKQSDEIKLEALNVEMKYVSLLEVKEEEIRRINLANDNLRASNTEEERNTMRVDLERANLSNIKLREDLHQLQEDIKKNLGNSPIQHQDFQYHYERFKKEKPALFKSYGELAKTVSLRNMVTGSNADIVTYAVANNLIERTGNNVFSMTPKGQYFYQEWINEKSNNL